MTDRARSEALTVLQITDVHLLARPGDRLLGVDTWDTVNAVLDHALDRVRPDAMLVTGDIAHEPEPAVYERFETLIGSRFGGPVLMLAGNHDVLAAMGPSVVSELDIGKWTIIALDSHVDDEPAASVDELELARLKACCRSARGEHLLIATHHPPVTVDCPWLDKDRIQNGEELLEWLSEHTAVRAMVFGHAHQIVEASHRQIQLFGTPSTCFQFAPRSQRFAVDERKPGYRWLQLESDGSVISTVQRVEDYPLSIDLSSFNKE